MSIPILPQEVIDLLEARERLFRFGYRDRAFATLALSLRRVTTVCEAISTTFETAPDDDAEFDRLNVAFGNAIEAASRDLTRWRGSRDCEAEG